MIFLPIVGRELRVASRRWPTYWLRAGAAFGAIALGTFMYAMYYSNAPHEIAKEMFRVLSWLAIVYSLFAGVRWTADSFSEEKREGTLGLLFLTDLKGYDVVLGKLVATSMGAFYGLISIFPVLAVPLLMGGITNGEFWRMALVLVNTFLFSLSVGMIVSTLSVSARKGMAGTLCLILLVTVVLPLAPQMTVWFRRWPRVTEGMFLGCPFYAYTESFDQVYAVEFKKFWWTMGVIHGLSWICLVLACLIAPSCWQDRAAGAAATRRRALWQQWSFGDPGERVAFRRRLLDVNAFYWLAGRARLKPVHVWTFYGVVALGWLWGWLEMGGEWFSTATYIMTGCIVNSVLKFWVASEAGRRLGEDRRLGALELLLSTPLSVGDILRGQWLALRRQFLGPVLFAVVVEFSFMVASIRREAYQTDPGYPAFWLAMILMLLVDVIALVWVGMWVALTAHNPNRATGQTVLRLLILPWLVMLVVAMLSAISRSNRFESGSFLLGMWVVTGLVFDLLFGLDASWHLRTSFREVAIQRFTRRRSWLRRWLGGSEAAPKVAAKPAPAGTE